MNAIILNCSPVKSGATARIAERIAEDLAGRFDVNSACIGDYRFGFCLGCRTCHSTAKCVLEDDVPLLMDEFDRADVIVCVSPSYWADVPGQFKAFIDRCTPWCDTHEPHASIAPGKLGYVVALRTGPSMRECERIFQSIEHFYGHLHIASRGRLGLCSVEYRDDVEPRLREIDDFCKNIIEDSSEVDRHG